jgi:hypothetical protein
MTARLKDEDAAADMKAAGLDPLEPYPGTSRPWRCRCLTCDREVSPKHAHVARNGGGCRYCKGYSVDIEEARAVMLAAGVEPLTPYPGSKVPWQCRCLTCDREVTPRFDMVKQGQGGCAFCGGKRVDPETARLAMESTGVVPITAYPGAHLPWPCCCTSCGQVVTPTYGSVRLGRGGCKHCAPFGYWSATGPATLYLVASEEWRAVKIGIARQGRERRLDTHRARGWRVLETWDDLEPEVAWRAERRVLADWRALGIPDAVPRQAMPSGGWTETAPIDLVDLARLRQLVRAELSQPA